MLWSPNIVPKSIAALGAIATILLLGLDPFVQQLLSYSTVQVSIRSEDVRVKKASYFNESLPSLDIVNRGIYSDTFDFPLQSSCDTGNCTWLQYDSMAWCNVCEKQDLTHVALIDCQTPYSDSTDSFPYPDLRNGSLIFGSLGVGFALSCDVKYKESEYTTPLSICFMISPDESDPQDAGAPRTASIYLFTSEEGTIVTSGNPNFVSGANSWTPSISSPFTNPLFAVLYLKYDYTLNNLTVRPYIKEAQECFLSPCINKNIVSMQAGKVKIESSTIRYGSVNATDSDGDRTLYWTAGPESIQDYIVGDTDVTNASFASSHEQTNFRSDESLDRPIPNLNSVFDGLLKKLEGEITSARWYYKVVSDNSTADPEAVILELLNTTGNEYPVIKADRGSETLAFIVANGGMENAVRRIGAALNNATLDNSTEYVSGSSQSLHVKVEVRPLWLILPVFLVVLCTIFLVLTIWMSRGYTKTRAWKDSVLPLLYHGLDNLSERDR